jgi:hypothetical protein
VTSRRYPILSLLVVAVAALISAPLDCAADTTTAVWYGEIWEYGIVSTGTPGDTLRPMVPLYTEPGDSTAVDSIRVGTFIKYERLSELKRVAPISLANDRAFKGEWFRVNAKDANGWLRHKNLMTFLGSDWGRDPTRHCQTFAGGSVLAAYVSGQYWNSWAGAVALWVRDSRNNRWILGDVVLNAFACGLYTFPVIDSFVDEYEQHKRVATNAYLRSIGGDAGESWGERVIFRIAGDTLTIIHREDFHEVAEDSP